ncbi:hypothetical protein KC19_VG180500 [Ceratodon purpureus]|uniref:Uncharacterized protein n=1 Tax=Ceratodon purpureus TaxID=3225 RepID=A0A8T0HSD0_CERPU|nr:hypothetical protein KC19_VG180500 [Ceratodon purpureus]
MDSDEEHGSSYFVLRGCAELGLVDRVNVQISDNLWFQDLLVCRTILWNKTDYVNHEIAVSEGVRNVGASS